jgi:1-acyl-sn-glycerol-3-phosphate acyltransferase
MIPFVYIILFIILLLLLFIWSLFLKIKNKRGINKPNAFYAYIVKGVSDALLHLFNVSVKVTGEEKLPDTRKFLLVNNHLANFDQMAILKFLKRKYRPIIFVSKPQNMHIPICGPFITRAGYIPINREDPREGLKAINKAVEYMEQYDVPIGISPEGTRNKTKDLMLPFHPGSFKIATKAQCPIVVIALHNTNLVHKRLPFRHTTIYLNVLDVVYPEDYKDMNTIEIAEKCRNEILADLRKEK